MAFFDELITSGVTGGAGAMINQDVFLYSNSNIFTNGDEIYLRSGYVSDDLSTYPDATQYSGIDTASYTNKSFSVASQETSPGGVTFSSDGTKMYIVGSSSDTVYQYALSTAWDVSTASYASKSFFVGGTEGVPTGVTFASDGTKMYIIGASSDRVYQYTLSTAWDVSTASYASKSFFVAFQEPVPHGVEFSSDGTKMYVVGDTNDVYQYTLSTAWDVSTASYDSKSFNNTGGRGVEFSSDGITMHGIGSNRLVRRYILSTAWDVSTASFGSSFSVLEQDQHPHDVTFSSDGTKMYVVGQQTDTVYQYTIPAVVVGLVTEHTRGGATQYVRVK